MSTITATSNIASTGNPWNSGQATPVGYERSSTSTAKRSTTPWSADDFSRALSASKNKAMMYRVESFDEGSGKKDSSAADGSAAGPGAGGYSTIIAVPRSPPSPPLSEKGEKPCASTQQYNDLDTQSGNRNIFIPPAAPEEVYEQDDVISPISGPPSVSPTLSPTSTTSSPFFSRTHSVRRKDPNAPPKRPTMQDRTLSFASSFSWKVSFRKPKKTFALQSTANKGRESTWQTCDLKTLVPEWTGLVVQCREGNLKNFVLDSLGDGGARAVNDGGESAVTVHRRDLDASQRRQLTSHINRGDQTLWYADQSNVLVPLKDAKVMARESSLCP
ncbi:hypothetical protein IAT38_007783 [Cryptococcus sp. DSM 104549]